MEGKFLSLICVYFIFTSMVMYVPNKMFRPEKRWKKKDILFVVELYA